MWSCVCDGGRAVVVALDFYVCVVVAVAVSVALVVAVRVHACLCVCSRGLGLTRWRYTSWKSILPVVLTR